MNEILKAIQDALDSKGVTAAAASRAAAGNPSLIKNMMNARGENPRYSYQALEKLADVLDLEIYFGPKRGSGPVDHLAYQSDRSLPHLGMARCSVDGWADDMIEREKIPRPLWVTDNQAFWVSAQGSSMMQEGILSGDFCVISPGRAPQIGDRVWIREASSEGRIAIKRLIDLDSENMVLRGWLPPEKGAQSDFTEKRPLSAVAEMYPVIGVYRGRLGMAGVNVRFVSDPREGQGAASDDFQVVRLLDQGIPAPDRWRLPPALGFPKSWLSRLQLSPDQLALVAVQDDDLSPMLPQWSTAMIDTSHKKTIGRQLLAIQRDQVNRIRWVQEISDGSLLLSGNDPFKQPEAISPEKRQSVEILGRVVWSGGRL